MILFLYIKKARNIVLIYVQLELDKFYLYAWHINDNGVQYNYNSAGGCVILLLMQNYTPFPIDPAPCKIHFICNQKEFWMDEKNSDYFTGDNFKVKDFTDIADWAPDGR